MEQIHLAAEAAMIAALLESPIDQHWVFLFRGCRRVGR
jgi:hypothetical protein